MLANQKVVTIYPKLYEDRNGTIVQTNKFSARGKAYSTNDISFTQSANEEATRTRTTNATFTIRAKMYDINIGDKCVICNKNYYVFSIASKGIYLNVVARG